jgi:O-antigen ligase
MTARHSTMSYEAKIRPTGVSLQLNARRLLVVSLFFVLAGNISLTEAGDQSSASTAIVRAAGLASGIGCLLIAISRQAELRIDAVALWLAPFAIFIAYCTFSAAWSLQPSATLIRSAETMTTIGFAALWAHVASRQSNSERDLCTWIATAVVGVALYGLLVNAVLFGEPIRIVVNREESERARFVFGSLHPLAVGDILAIGVMAAIMSAIRLSLKVLALLLLLPLLYLTNATGAILLVSVIAATYLGARAVRSTGIARTIILLPFGVIAAYFAVAIAFALELPVTQRIMEDQRIWTLTGRTQLWGAIWDSGLASTWFGTGFDAARNAILEIFGVAYQVHNQYLAILVELGYIGLALFILVLVIWLVPIIRSRSLVIGCFAVYILGINMDNASMFTKTWLIFLTVFCYVLALDLAYRSARMAGQPIRLRS